MCSSEENFFSESSHLESKYKYTVEVEEEEGEFSRENNAAKSADDSSSVGED